VATVVKFPQHYIALKQPIQPGKGVGLSFSKHLTHNNGAFIVTAHHTFDGRLRVADLTVVTGSLGEQDITGVDCTVINAGSSPVSSFYVNLTRIKA
jgi:hypothetical protein